MKDVIKVITLLLVCSCFSCQNKDEGKSNAGIKHVFVIGIDAMSSQGLEKASTPNMDYLIENGAVCRRVRTVLPSSSSSNWASMLAGAGVEVHGVLSNDWEPGEYNLLPVVKTEYGMFPTVVSVVREQLPDDKIGMIYHWSGFGRLFEKNIASVDKSYETEKATAEALADYIRIEKPTFTFTQLDDVDHQGHKHGHMTEGYLEGITEVDKCVGEIHQAIRDAGIENESLIMIVSDHGGIGYGHGGNTWEEVTTPFILYGKGVKKGVEVSDQVYMYDVAPTITYALGLNAPQVWTGRPIRTAFVGNESKADPIKIKKLNYAPLINGGRKLFDQAGGLFIDKEAEVTLEAYSPKDKVYYTTDGTEPNLNSALYESPFTLKHSAVVKAKSISANGDESLTAEGYFRVLQSNPANGIDVSFYIGKNWLFLPVFKNEKVVKQWNTPEIRLDKEQITSLLPEGHNNFGLVFNTYLQIDQDGEYTFYLQSDDGSKMYINEEVVVDNDGGHGLIEKEGKIALKKGKHKLRVEYFNDHGGYWIETFYKGPSTTRQIIPADKLFRTN